MGMAVAVTVTVAVVMVVVMIMVMIMFVVVVVVMVMAMVAVEMWRGGGGHRRLIHASRIKARRGGRQNRFPTRRRLHLPLCARRQGWRNVYGHRDVRVGAMLGHVAVTMVAASMRVGASGPGIPATPRWARGRDG